MDASPFLSSIGGEGMEHAHQGPLACSKDPEAVLEARAAGVEVDWNRFL